MLFLLKLLILAAMLLGLPLMGVYLAGYPIGRYLEFPPPTRFAVHTHFSWPAFIVFAGIILAVVLKVAALGHDGYQTSKSGHPVSASGPFPTWGWLGVFTGFAAWILAWTRFSWFRSFQPHTFSPLWLSYIIVVNALCVRQSGRCLMTDRRGFFLLLFPASAAFWWFFEYLNRFVLNWHYTGVEFGPTAYFWFATLSFSSVLPAVLSTQRWLQGTRWLNQGYGHIQPFSLPCPRTAAAGVLILSAGGLAGIGVWPDYLFSLVWVAPLLILTCLQTLTNEPHLLSQTAAGDWRDAVSAALAALICGLFWEMWNYFSLAKWEYTVPLVDRFHIFEMPLLGYAGYLPFGLECALVGDILGKWILGRQNG